MRLASRLTGMKPKKLLKNQIISATICRKCWRSPSFVSLLLSSCVDDGVNFLHCGHQSPLGSLDQQPASHTQLDTTKYIKDHLKAKFRQMAVIYAWSHTHGHIQTLVWCYSLFFLVHGKVEPSPSAHIEDINSLKNVSYINICLWDVCGMEVKEGLSRTTWTLFPERDVAVEYFKCHF